MKTLFWNTFLLVYQDLQCKKWSYYYSTRCFDEKYEIIDSIFLPNTITSLSNDIYIVRMVFYSSQNNYNYLLYCWIEPTGKVISANYKNNYPISKVALNYECYSNYKEIYFIYEAPKG